jgi:hypothetical protein
MAGLIFREARTEDHAALERLFRETSMAGAIRIGSDRSPDFFAGSRVQAEEICVWGVFTGDGRAVGAFSMGKRRVWLNQEQVPMRYLSDLRIHPDWRNGTMLAKGFRTIRENIFEKGEWAQTLVLEENLPALEFLRSRRAGLPEYREAGRYRNWLLPRQKVPARGLSVRAAVAEDLPAMGKLLEAASSRRSFSPVVDLGGLGSPYLNGLQVGDFVIAEGGGEIVGMMAVWDQGAFQRLRIAGYSPGMAAVRPLWNLGARLKLPRPGNTIPMAKASMVACADDDPAILRAMLAAVCSKNFGRLLSVGLSESDPLVAALSGLRGRVFRGLHFLVGWEGEPPDWREPFGFDPARI